MAGGQEVEIAKLSTPTIHNVHQRGHHVKELNHPGMTTAVKQSKSPPPTTHHWQWTLEVENDFRNSSCRIEYRWYSTLAVFFEASWVAGPPPSRALPEHRIRVLSRGQEAGVHRDRDSALGQVRKLLGGAPAPCREHALAESWAYLDTIFGPGGWKLPSSGIE